MSETIENIVINGGGPAIFNIYGALKQSNLDGIWSHDSVHSYYGTSAGGIMSVIMALQYSWDEMDDFIIKRPWQNVWKINVLNTYEYYLKKGVYGIELYYDVFGPLFRGKDLELTITLKEFYEVSKKNIYLYAVKLSTFEIKKQIEELYDIDNLFFYPAVSSSHNMFLQGDKIPCTIV